MFFWSGGSISRPPKALRPKIERYNLEVIENVKIVELIEESQIVINKGSRHNIKIGSKFLLYKLGDEIFDPDTNESLGVLEIIAGKGEAVNVQEFITTLKIIPFGEVSIGSYLVKPI